MPETSAQRPGPSQGDRAVVAPGDDPGPPAAWAPAVLAAHGVLLCLVAVVALVLWTVGVDTVGSRPGLPGRMVAWTVGVLIVVAVVRSVGRRHPRRLDYWLAGTACWVVVPLAWLTVTNGAFAPEEAHWFLLIFLLSPYGGFYLLPLLLIGAVWTAVLAVRRS